MTFYGIKSNGETVAVTLALTNTILALERFEIRGFDDLVSLSWFQIPAKAGQPISLTTLLLGCDEVVLVTHRLPLTSGVSVSQRLGDSLSMNHLKSLTSHAKTAGVT